MKRPSLIAILVGVAVFAALLFWGFYATPGGSWAGGSWVLAAVMTGGVLATGALAGGLMWLAFYSARKGYDDDQGGFQP